MEKTHSLITQVPAPRTALSLMPPHKTTPAISQAVTLESLEQVLNRLVARLESRLPLTDEGPHDLNPKPEEPPPRVPSIDRLRALMKTRTSLLVSDVARELNLKEKTAYRLSRALSHIGECVLMYETNGNVDRLRLYRPDRVVAEK